MVRRGRRRTAAVVVTPGAAGGDADRLLLAHMVGDFGLRSALIVMAALFGVGSGLRHRGQRDERQGGSSHENFANGHVGFSIVTLGRHMVAVLRRSDLDQTGARRSSFAL